MHMNPYLIFDGECEEAFRFYRDVLGGDFDTMMTHGDSPDCADVPFEWYEKILHVRLVAGDNVLMGSDAPPGFFEPAAGMSVALAFDDPAEAERVYKAFAEGGSVRMPMQETFWAARFGMVADRFGIPWIVNGGLVEEPSKTERETTQCAS